ncbi:MAG TPA: S41 family peptidase, partial [Longimicrobium sp.]
DARAQGVRPGDRVLSVNGYTPTRRNAWRIQYVFNVLRPQPGLRVVVQPPGGEPRQLDVAARVGQRARIVDLTEVGEDIYALIREAQNEAWEARSRGVEIGDVLVWKLPTLDVEDAVLREGLRQARGKRALVLDLRGNGGGPVRTLAMLLEGLSAQPLRIGTWHERGGRTEQLATRGGSGAFTGELLVLVDSESASAAEVTARVVQLAGRGVVLGDRTAGAVMRGRYHGLSTGAERVVMYGVNVTEADLVMADGGRLEGTGVVPDEIILPGPSEMAAGEDPVLAVALERLGVPMDPAQAGTLFPEP